MTIPKTNNIKEVSPYTWDETLGKYTALVDKQGDIISAIENVNLTITNAIDETAYDLNAAPFSKVTNISNDYFFDNVEFNFSTAESKTISITTADGTVIYSDTNTEQNICLPFKKAFNDGEDLTVTVTQFSSPGTMDCILKVQQGGVGLVGNPVLGAGTEVIGKVRLVDENGAEVTDPDYKCVNVCDQDRTTEPVELFLCELLSTTALAVNSTIDTKDVTLSPGHGAVVGNLLCFKENKSFLQTAVTAVSGDDITIDMPLDFAFTTAATIDVSNREMNVDGSTTTKIFLITPGGLNNVNFHIQKLRFSLVGTGTLKGEDFASIVGGLDNGIVFRITDGYVKNVGNVKTNDDFSNRTEAAYNDKPLYNLRAVKDIKNDFGVVVKLTSADSDQLQILIQDNLNVAGVPSFRCLAQGHVTKE